MDFLPEDETFMARALELAQQNAAFASPNPAVGCVIARDQTALGEGAHRYATFDHAEIVALRQAAARGHDARGATAYVTLEPCSHHGRTGPCADALIVAGIARAVVATADPNPRVSGSGIARMRAAGIDVAMLAEPSTLAQQARELNDAFAFSIQHARPFVTLKAAVSLDGMLAPNAARRSTTAPVWLTGEAARADVQRLRHASDAILTGIGTVLADDPHLTDRSGAPRGRKLLRIVLDTHLRTPANSKLLQTTEADTLIVTSETSRSISANLELLHVPQTSSAGLDLTAVLAALNTRNIRSVLLECGSRLNAAFLRAGLVDRIILYIADVELGANAIPFATGWGSPYTLQQSLTRIRRTTFSRHDAAHEDVRITGYLHNPWP